jgi:site-specific DNA-cytosine methylase
MEQTMKIGSLFSGGGGGDLGFTNSGHEIVFGCEIDPRARSVFRFHHPNIPIYHDVREVTHDRLKADGVPFPDLIMGGSPCQDLSVAGKRAGLGGERSGLFHEQCRIADELGSEWVVWENVAGAFSSNGGEDFAAVLGGLTGNTPIVPKRGWRNAGVCVGPNRVAVWRVLDAQNFGVPQRRRRVFVVAGPRTLARRVVEVLLDPESSERDSPTRGKSWEDIAASDDEVAVFDLYFSGAFQPMTNGLCSSLKVASPPAITRGTTSRALTPLECERLMGWPDDYTAHGITDEGNHVDIANTNRYRICGNGIVATVTEWIGGRLPTVTGVGDSETTSNCSNHSPAATSQT